MDEDRNGEMTFKGCVFDFSWTVFRAGPAEAWLRAVRAAQGAAPDEDATGCPRRLEGAGAQPGGTPPEDTTVVGGGTAACGAAAPGRRVPLVDPRPVGQRPDCPRGVLDLLG